MSLLGLVGDVQLDGWFQWCVQLVCSVRCAVSMVLLVFGGDNRIEVDEVERDRCFCGVAGSGWAVVCFYDMYNDGYGCIGRFRSDECWCSRWLSGFGIRFGIGCNRR